MWSCSHTCIIVDIWASFKVTWSFNTLYVEVFCAVSACLPFLLVHGGYFNIHFWYVYIRSGVRSRSSMLFASDSCSLLGEKVGRCHLYIVFALWIKFSGSLNFRWWWWLKMLGLGRQKVAKITFMEELVMGTLLNVKFHLKVWFVQHFVGVEFDGSLGITFMNWWNCIYCLCCTRRKWLSL